MEIGEKLRDNKMYADTIGVWFKYNYFDKLSKQEKLDNSISTDSEIYDNAIRIFDNISILRGKREEDFAPVKNLEGEDSPKTAKKLYENYWKNS